MGEERVDALQDLVEAGLKLMRGEDVDHHQLAAASAASLSSMLSDLATIKAIPRIVAEYAGRLEKASNIIAYLLAERLPVASRLRERLASYVAGMLVGADNCLVTVERAGRSLKVRCSSVDEAIVMAAAGKVELLKLRVT